MKIYLLSVIIFCILKLPSEVLCFDNSDVPVIVVPGFLGTVPKFQYFPRFAFTRGVEPYVFEPAQEYEPLLEELKSTGKEIVFAGYDWRIRPVNFDGVIDGNINHKFEIGEVYKSGLDYLIESLAKLVIENDNRKVDVIAHSTGGLIVRAYIQSNYYGQEIVYDGQKILLPEIRNLIMISVPNLGTPFAWNPWNGNMSSMKGFTRAGNVFKLIFDLIRSGFSNVNGPDHIISSSNLKGADGVDKFLRLYMPSLIDLLPVYEFLITGSRDTIRPLPVNNFLLDLNADLTWSSKVFNLILTSGIDNPTSDYLLQMFGKNGEVYKLNDIENPRPTREYEEWYLDLKIDNNGDEVIPFKSLVANLVDHQIVLWSNDELNIDSELIITSYLTDHVRLLVNEDFIKWITNTLN